MFSRAIIRSTCPASKRVLKRGATFAASARPQRRHTITTCPRQAQRSSRRTTRAPSASRMHFSTKVYPESDFVPSQTIAPQEPDHQIVGVHILKAAENDLEVHKTLAAHQASVRTRLGLRHEGGRHGLILLELDGTVSARDNLMAALKAIPNVQVQSMSFMPPVEVDSHPYSC